MSGPKTGILIKGGKVVNDDFMEETDVLIEDGKIKNMGHNLNVPDGVKVIDAKGKLVIPGGIDTHTHMQMPFMGTCTSDDFYTGTRAALAGGTTMIIDFVACTRGSSLLKMYEQYREWADAKVCCDYGLHVIVPHFDANVSKEMEMLVREKGINSFKAFMAYRDVYMLEDDELYDVFRRCRELGALALVHAENGKVIERRANELFSTGVTGPEGHYYSRPSSVESEATQRAITLAQQANCPLYVVHVMSKDAAEKVAEARREGAIVFGEPIAAGLATDGSHYFHSCWRHAAGYVLSPPLREEADTGEHLMRLLANGDLECVGTDHCVFRQDQKALGKDDFRKIPNGINGVEDRMSVVWEKGVETGILDPCKFVAVTSSNAAKVFNIYPRKGRIAIGSDADVVVWDPEAERTISVKTHHQNVDFNIFEGMKCHGVAHAVITRGQLVLEEAGGSINVTQGAGKFISTPANCQYVFGRVAIREQQRAVKPVVRDPYTGPVISLEKATTEQAASGKVGANEADGGSGDHFHNRPPTRSGGRNMQDSTFSLSGDQVDDKQQQRSSVRTHHPPGGATSTRLW